MKMEDWKPKHQFDDSYRQCEDYVAPPSYLGILRQQRDAAMVPQLPVEPAPKNYAVWQWSKRSRAWCLMGRFSSPQEANKVAGETMIVIDVCSDRMIWWRGDLASRAKPSAVPKLEIQKYTDA